MFVRHALADDYRASVSVKLAEDDALKCHAFYACLPSIHVSRSFSIVITLSGSASL